MVFFHVEEQSGSKGDETAVFEGVSRVHLVETHRFRVLERGVGRLCGGDLSGGEHVERYLRHKYRTNLSAGTISSTVSVLHGFLSFLRGTGRGHLEQISRRDLEAFIEHEQDRGLRASTVNGKLKVVKAFVRFLMGQEVIGPEVLLKRLTVRVPEGLPRVMESEDVRRLLGVIGDVRDRAMVMVLLRAGMRIGELLNTKVGDVLLEERKILIYEAQKNRVGRVVYLSDDALGLDEQQRPTWGVSLLCSRNQSDELRHGAGDVLPVFGQSRAFSQGLQPALFEAHHGHSASQCGDAFGVFAGVAGPPKRGGHPALCQAHRPHP